MILLINEYLNFESQGAGMNTDLYPVRLRRIVYALFWLIAIGLVGGCSLPGVTKTVTASPEPILSPVPAYGSILGIVWHDVCSNIDHGGAPPPGCMIAADTSGFVADGILKTDEPGIQGVQLTLGQGFCPSEGLATATTGPDGRFTFSDLTPGVYCVTADASNHQPGVWTYPVTEGRTGDGSIVVTLGAGELKDGVNFGWDYLLLPPAATLEPEDTPVPTPSCTDRASFIKDVTIPDGTYLVIPEESFEKVWRLKNTGTCMWTSEYSFMFISGYSMGGPGSVPLPGAVSPGSIVDLSVNLRVPKTHGLYKGYWMLRNPSGNLFGIGEGANEPFWVQINVGPEPPPEITDWRGEYFDNRELEGDPVLVRNDEEINFNWKREAPADKLPANNFSARWTREFEFDAAIYRFQLRFDDGIRFTVDDRLVIDEWEDGSDRVVTVDLAMFEGEHDLLLEYYEHGDNARVHLSWEKLTSQDYPEWMGEYWFNRTLDSDWGLVRNDLEINFDWGKGSPALGIPNDDFSVRWSRQVDFEPGVYLLYAQADDGIRLYVDDIRVLDEWHASDGSDVYTVELVLDGLHGLQVEYYEHGGKAKVKFWWDQVGVVNTPPVAVDDVYSMDEDSVISVTAPGVLDNDDDIDGDPLTAVLESGTSKGSLTLDSDGSFTYMPNPDFNGTDSFIYKAYDGNSNSNVATVTVIVNPVDDIPQAFDDSAETLQETPVYIEVLENDIGIGDVPIAVAITDLPEHGTVVIDSDQIQYTPNTGFFGTDVFTYTVTDADGDGSTATVTVMVVALNYPPIAGDDAFGVDEDVVLSVDVPGVLANDSDSEGDPLTAVLESGTSHGSLALNAGGSFTYEPNLDFNGTDTFTYKSNDGSSDSNVASVTITVNPVDDLPVAVDDSVTIEDDTPVDIEVLGNDTGLGDTPISVTIVSQPMYGSVMVVGDHVQYTPSEEIYSVDSFIYGVSDADGDSSSATVSVLSGLIE